MSVLVYLAERAGATVTHQELLAEFWRGAVSSPNAVHKCVTELRHAFGNGGAEAAYIETVPKRGYRLAASVTRVENPVGLTHAPVATAAVEPKPALVPPVVRSRRPRWVPVIAAVLAIGAIGLASFWWLSRDTATAESAPPTIAVLKFRNVDGNTEHEYLAEGFADSLTRALARVPNVTVVDRDRAFQHSLANETVQQIGAALGVTHVLEGSVQRLDDRIRVSAVLHESRSGNALYAYREDRPIDKLLDVEAKVTAEMLQALEIYLDDQQLAAMREGGTRNVEAHLAVLEGFSFRQKLDQRSIRYAAQRFRDAIALDPGFLSAYAQLAVALGDLGTINANDATHEALRAEVQALHDTVKRIDSTSVQERVVAAIVAKLGFRSWADYESEIRGQIQELSADEKGEAFVYGRYADILKTGRLFDEARAYLDLQESLTGESPWVHFRRQEIVGITEGAHAVIPMQKKTLQHFPNNIATLTGLVTNLASIGRFDEAESYLARLRGDDAEGQWAHAAWIQLSILRGELAVGSDELRVALADPRTSAFARGIALLMLGDVESGVAAWREMGPALREMAFMYTVNVEYFYPSAVVTDARYQAYLEEFGIGRRWTNYLRDRVAELAPIAGISPSGSMPQVVRTRDSTSGLTVAAAQPPPA